MKRKSIRKHSHSHIKKVDGAKKSVWHSTWTFSIITVGLAILILGLVISIKQQTQVLGATSTTNSSR